MKRSQRTPTSNTNGPAGGAIGSPGPISVATAKLEALEQMARSVGDQRGLRRLLTTKSR